jgi:hypothetical protein
MASDAHIEGAKPKGLANYRFAGFSLLEMTAICRIISRAIR